jgi:predicted nucleic acid-binding protein
MSGVKYLLDTNFILGMLKSTPEVLAVVGSSGLMTRQCAFSSVTRMELLGYPGITADEDALIRQRLAQFTLLSISLFIEDRAIELRRSRRIKLPDALVAATALCHGLELLTMDAGLQAVLRSATSATHHSL